MTAHHHRVAMIGNGSVRKALDQNRSADSQFEAARDAYEKVLNHQPDHAKVLQQLGWLHCQPGAAFLNLEKAVEYLTKSLEAGEWFSSFPRNSLKPSLSWFR